MSPSPLRHTALFTALSLITGRKQSRLWSIGKTVRDGAEGSEYWVIEKNRFYLVYAPPISRLSVENIITSPLHLSLFDTTETVPFRLPLPKGLTPFLRLFLKRHLKTPFKQNIRTIPEKLYEGLDRPISLAQVSAFLGFQLKPLNVPTAVKGYLIGSHPNEDVALYYTQLAASDIQRPYLFFLDSLGIPIWDIPSAGNALVGSSLKVNETILSGQLAEQREQIENGFDQSLSSCVQLHNHIAYYTLLVIQIMTGHRHAIDAIRSIHYFCSETGHLFANDKNARLVKLPRRAVDQLKAYISYLRFFYVKAKANYETLAETILASLDGRQPLLFLLQDAQDRKQFKREYLKTLVLDRWPLPENFPRHYIQCKLLDKTTAEVLSGAIGHLMTGQAADDKYSGLSVPDLANFANAAETVGRELNLQPMKLTFQEPELTVTPSKTSNVKKDLYPERYWSDGRFIASSTFLAWDDQFAKQLKDYSPDVSDHETLRALIVFSAITRGGLYDPKMVEALDRALIQNRLNLWAIDKTSFITLRYQIKKGSYNLRVRVGNDHAEELAYRTLDWPVDPQTILLLHEYAKWPLKPLYQSTSKDTLGLLKTYFEPANCKKSVNSLAALCRLAPWVAMARLKADISYALINIGLGTTSSFSLDKESLIALFSKPAKISLDGDQVVHRSIPTPRKARYSVSDIYNAIEQALKDATTTPDAIRRLTNVYETERHNQSPAAHYLTYWLLHKLKTIKKGSAANYLGRIGKAWLKHMGTDDPDEFDEVQFLDCYQRLSADLERLSNPTTKIDALRWLHEFGMEHYGWPGSEDISTLLRSGPAKSFVRTYIASHPHVYAVLKSFENLHKSDLEIIQLKLITLLAFRGGLRITEILKLRIRDINPGETWTILIKGTRSGSNKTLSSLRTSYAISWMTHEERTLFQSYFHNYKIGRNKPSHHLFGELGEDQMLCPHQTSVLIGQAFKQSMQHSGFVFHSLRHTYASMMQCIIEKAWDLAEIISGHKTAKLKVIRTNLLGHESFSRDGYWEVAKSCGHKTPGQTTLTYSHMSHLISYETISKAVYMSEGYQAFLKAIKNVRPYEIEATSFDTMSKRLIKKNKTLYQNVLAPSSTKTAKVSFDGGFKPSLAILRAAITEVEKREDFEAVVQRFPMFEDTLSSIIKRADNLMEVGTTSTGAKFATTKMMNNRDRWCLAPDLPDYPDARYLAAELSAFFITKSGSKRGRKQTLDWCKVILKSATASLHYLKFTHPNDLRTAMDFPREVLLVNHWNIDLYITVKKTLPDAQQRMADLQLLWRTRLPDGISLKSTELKYSRKASANEFGLAFATIDHHAKGSRQRGKYMHGSKTLVWVAYMLMLQFATDLEVEEFIEGL